MLAGEKDSVWTSNVVVKVAFGAALLGRRGYALNLHPGALIASSGWGFK